MAAKQQLHRAGRGALARHSAGTPQSATHLNGHWYPDDVPRHLAVRLCSIRHDHLDHSDRVTSCDDRCDLVMGGNRQSSGLRPVHVQKRNPSCLDQNDCQFRGCVQAFFRHLPECSVTCNLKPHSTRSQYSPQCGATTNAMQRSPHFQRCSQNTNSRTIHPCGISRACQSTVHFGSAYLRPPVLVSLNVDVALLAYDEL